jgi:transcriptional regulator with XRE-family HTH domain
MSRCPPSSDDERMGVVLKAIRRRLGVTQKEVSARAQVPVRDVIDIEAGRAGTVPLGRLRAVFSAVDGRARVTTWWNGAAADRLVDERHAGLVERTVGVLAARGWETAVEVTFSEFGERGSIDVLGAHRAEGAVAVGEIKGSIGSMEEMNRTLDVKERLAPKLCRARFGFTPRVVGRLLVLPDDRTIRRLIDRHSATMRATYPARSRDVRAWLRSPDRPLRGVWFLSDLRDT